MAAALLALTCLSAPAQEAPDTLLELRASTVANFSSGRFAPYYIGSGRYGLTTQKNGIMELAEAVRPLSTRRRFEYGFGTSVAFSETSSAPYSRYADGAWTEVRRHPAAVRLQTLWAGVKWRGVFIWAGMKEERNPYISSPLGVGDIILSDNARPVPQVRAGFVDFQNIPFTRGWAQIQGELAYGKMADSDWLEDHYNYYNSFLTTGSWMHYARLYLRSNPSKPFSVTVGMQHAAQFGGYYRRYQDGRQTAERKLSVKFKDIVNAFFPWTGGSSTMEGDQAFYDGNHLGSWDLRLRYRLHEGSEIALYAQFPWEDGSGIGKLNGLDGVWGLQYKAPDRGAVLTEAVAEYIDFTNQSGPMHWAPGDFPGTQVPSQATGADDYYNNYMYNGWANYGMALGTPFAKSPLYNTDGYMRFTDNRLRGFALGAAGNAPWSLEWQARFSYRQSWGTPFQPAPCKRHDASMLLQASRLWAAHGLRLSAALAYDCGNLYGNSLGAMFTLQYTFPVKMQ